MATVSRTGLQRPEARPLYDIPERSITQVSCGYYIGVAQVSYRYTSKSGRRELP
jgi:hypothetical protein